MSPARDARVPNARYTISEDDPTPGVTDRRIRMAFAFDGHFAEAGFQMIG
jgi:hypothetical protein